ncbi:Uma2 family endonuclease [Lederbergia sp. NSJ-179]|uniref:Uma2 family endonuclease n=1 Tax=Lederbergia sp. NSJ-179 TaxID=2931402 RepID=UPI001FD38935|nr:Uma2 family endonuclease [Lederbergia sp. NSJ-179]MCJ7842045.1 Uma2 family endonuclease [Lederbergia sp. NSJ-179]
MYDKGKKEVSGHDLLKEKNLTYEDYASIDDGLRYELADGQLELMSPGASVTHQMLSFEMQKVIAKSCESEYLILCAPLDVILAPKEVRQPDLILVHRQRMNIIKKHGIEGPPDLVVEILSPSSIKRDKMDKLETYALYQIPEYWIVEPQTGILEAYILQGKQYKLANIFLEDEIVTSPHIPCLSFTMAEIMDKIPDLEDE